MKTYNFKFVITLTILNILVLIVLFNCIDCQITLFCLSCIKTDDLINMFTLFFTMIAVLMAIKTFRKTNMIKSTEFYLLFKDRFKQNESYTSIRELLYESSKNK